MRILVNGIIPLLEIFDMPTSLALINPRIQPGERRRVITGVPGKTGLSTRSTSRRASF